VHGGLKTPNQGIEALGGEPAVDKPGMDDFWMPTKTRPVEELVRAEPEPQLHEDPAADPPPTKAKARPFALESKDTVETWLRKALESKLRFALRARTELTKHFAEQERAVLDILEAEEKQDEVEKQLLAFGWKESDDNFREVVEAMQAALADQAFEITAEAVGGHTPKEGLIDTVLKEVANRKDGIGSVTGRVKDDVIEEVRKGLSHGLTYRQIAEGGSFTSGVAGEGEVTIKGITQPAKLSGIATGPAVDHFGANRVGLHLQTTIDRTAYDMKWNMPLPNGEPALSNEVTLKAELTLVAQEA